MTLITQFILNNKLSSFLIVCCLGLSLKLGFVSYDNSILADNLVSAKTKIVQLEDKSKIDDSTITALRLDITKQNKSIDEYKQEAEQQQQQVEEALAQAEAKAKDLKEQNDRLARLQWTGDTCKDMQDMLKDLGE